jgi:Family of unknown function (DUF6338)
VPTTIVVLVVAVLFLAPGLVWKVGQRETRRRASAIHDLSALLLVSLGCTSAAVGVVAAMRQLWPTTVVDLGAWIRTDDFYFHRHYGVILSTVAMTALLACVLATLVLAATRRRATRNAVTGVLPSILDPKTDAPVRQPDVPRVVMVRTHNGTQFHGSFVALDEDDADTSAIALGGPIVFQRADGVSMTMPPEWDRIVLPMSDIAELWIRAPRAVAANMPSGPIDDSPREEPADRSSVPDHPAPATITEHTEAPGRRRRHRKPVPASS